MNYRISIIILLTFLNVSNLMFLKGQSLSELPTYDQDINIYLLRGIGRESGHWGTTFTERLLHHFPKGNLIKMDLPGSGIYFDQPALSSVDNMVEFLHNNYHSELYSHSGANVLLATSLAGNIALEWITKYPNDFSGITMVSSSLKGVCASKSRVKPEAKNEFIDIFFTSDETKRELKFLKINSNLQTNNDSLLRAWIDIQHEHPVSKTSLIKQTIAGALYQPPTEIPQIPILLVGSKADKIVAPSCLRSVSEYLHADLTFHNTSGHGLPIDAPVWLADQFAYWISLRVLPDVDKHSPFFHERVYATSEDAHFWDLFWLKKSMDSIAELTEETAKSSITFFRRML